MNLSLKCHDITWCVFIYFCLRKQKKIKQQHWWFGCENKKDKDFSVPTLFWISLARWANFSVLNVSFAALHMKMWQLHKQDCAIQKSVRHSTEINKPNTDHSEGLTFAIIVVFEFPPRESCTQIKKNSATIHVRDPPKR